MTTLWLRIRWWFFDTFGCRWTEKSYIGHGDYTEQNGWMFWGRFHPCWEDDQ